jgi:Bacterial Ig-like domain (group 2)
MYPTPRFLQFASLLIIFLLLAPALAAQQPESEKKAEVSLAVEPSRITLNAGQTQKFSAHFESAPTGTVVRWVIADEKKAGSSITQDGVFTAGTVGIYHVVAVAMNGEGTVLTSSVAKVTVFGRSEF